MKDKRIQKILDQILNYSASNYEVRTEVSENRDEVDAIIAGLNSLGEELQFQQEDQTDRENRKRDILEILLKYTMLDFSEKANISTKGDEIDAIAAGLNAMGEEIIYHREELESKASQLQTINKELESFTYSVSHDLRAPLRALNGYSQILLEEENDKLSDDGKRMIRKIMYNAKKMGLLIDNLLSYSRIGKTEINKTSLALDEMVRNVVHELSYSHSHNAEINIQSLGRAKGDYMLISLVFQNLISNAIKYSSKEKHPKVDIGCTETDKGKAYFVKDNGVGFNMAYYDKLFGVFQRLHQPEDYEGTGVGLAIVQRIITRHGGELWAEAEVNKGAEFYFTLG